MPDNGAIQQLRSGLIEQMTVARQRDYRVEGVRLEWVSGDKKVVRPPRTEWQKLDQQSLLALANGVRSGEFNAYLLRKKGVIFSDADTPEKVRQLADAGYPVHVTNRKGGHRYWSSVDKLVEVEGINGGMSAVFGPGSFYSVPADVDPCGYVVYQGEVPDPATLAPPPESYPRRSASVTQHAPLAPGAPVEVLRASAESAEARLYADFLASGDGEKYPTLDRWVPKFVGLMRALGHTSESVAEAARERAGKHPAADEWDWAPVEKRIRDAIEYKITNPVVLIEVDPMFDVPVKVRGVGEQPSAPVAGADHYPTLPGEFWAARPVFDTIRRAAWSRFLSGDAVLHAVLARLSAFASAGISIDSGIDSARLNLFAALVGPSGAGKSRAEKLASELLPLPEGLGNHPAKPLGSGEGIAESFMGTVEKPGLLDATGKAGKPRLVKQQTAHNVLFMLDEGQALARMFERNGATIGPALRTAWSGGTLGQTNGTADRTRHVDAGSYNMGLIVGFQPDVIAPLLDDGGTGMPQRFTFASATDPSIPDPNSAPPLAWQPIELPLWVWWYARQETVSVDSPANAEQMVWAIPGSELSMRLPMAIGVDAAITAELRTEAHAIATGRVRRGELDSQAPALRLKLGALVALLDGRNVVSVEDWALARTLWETSNAVRSALVGHVAGQRAAIKAARVQDSHDQAHAARVGSMSAEQEAEQVVIARVASLIVRTVTKLGTASKGDIAQALPGRDRCFRVEALALAQAQGLITEVDGKFTVGGGA